MAELLTETPLTLRRIDGLLVAVIPDELAQSLSLAEGDQISMSKPMAAATNGQADDLMTLVEDYMDRHSEMFEALAK